MPPEKWVMKTSCLIISRVQYVGAVAQFNIEIDPRDERLETLISVVGKEVEGWSFDSAEASFELLARQILGEVPEYFGLVGFV